MSKLSRLIPNIIKDYSLKSNTYKSKCSFAMLGPVGSGKTTVSGLLVITAITLSARQPGNFICDVIESQSGILEAQSLLRRGRFPPKTDPNSPLPYESGLLMKWPTPIRKKQVHIPICDVAGEVVADLATKYRDGMYDLEEKTFSETAFLVEQLKDRDGYVLTVTAPRAFMFKDDRQLEEEPRFSKDKDGKIKADPDVNLSRILEAVIDYKRRTKVHPIKGIAVVVTKYDMVKTICEQEGMDLYDESGVGFRNFMNTCFPATANKLRFFGLENVAFFPSEVELEQDQWPNGDDRIKILRRRPGGEPCRVPKYPEKQYVRLIEYLKSFAA